MVLIGSPIPAGEPESSLPADGIYPNGRRMAFMGYSGDPAHDLANGFTVRDITERKRFEEELHRAKIAAEAGNIAKGLAAGMDSYLSKPVNFNELIELVERLAGKRPE